MTTTNFSTQDSALHSKALLVNISISQWSGRKHDKKVTREVEEAHNAQTGEAGRFNKMLTSKDFLAGTNRTANAFRQYLYEQTLPWGDNGDRLLPSANYFDFLAGAVKYENDFNDEVNKAVDLFDEELMKAQVRLNGLFNRSDYPNKVEFKSKFSCKVCFMQLPDISDFRIDLKDTEVNVLRQSIESEMNNRLTESVTNIWERIQKQLEHMKERFTGTTVRTLKDGTKEEKPAEFKDSLFENLKDLIELLPKLNITNSPAINDICEAMKGLIIDPEKVRQSTMIRSRKAEEVNDILNKFDAYFS